MAQRGAWRGWSFFASVVVVIAGAVANTAIELPYYVESPGDVRDVASVIKVPADHAHPPKGRTDLVTVSVLHAHPVDWALGHLLSHHSVVPIDEVTGGASPQQFLRDNAQLMEESQQVAAAAALSRAGLPVTMDGTGAAVASVQAGSPSEGKFQPGDVIVGIDGQTVRVGDELVRSVRALPVGATARLQVRAADGSAREVDITTAPRPGDTTASYLGVSVQTEHLEFQTPFPITFEKTGIGGPSAGLSFTLSILDQVTAGELTGGARIAATGTMDATGAVGRIGGMEQKVAAVRSAGVHLFLVPKDEEGEAKRYAGKGLEVVGVSTLDDAIAALAAHGGDPSGLPASATPITHR